MSKRHKEGGARGTRRERGKRHKEGGMRGTRRERGKRYKEGGTRGTRRERGKRHKEGEHGHTIYNNTKKFLKISKTYVLMTTDNSSSSVLMTYNMPSGTTKHCKSNSHSHSFLFYFLFFRWAGSKVQLATKLGRSLGMRLGFHTKQQLITFSQH